MSDHSISLSPQGPPRTVLPAESAEVRHRLAQAAALASAERRLAAAALVADHPRSLGAWSLLGESEDEPVRRYAAFRVGYHRGLDALRGSGWKGSGYVRWSDETNRGFLGCLAGLGRSAGEIGESDEHERICLFLAQLDPQRWSGSSTEPS